MSKETLKKEFLIKIRSKKEILFGSFSNTLTKEVKSQAWLEIANFAKSVCLIPREKEWTYARDVLWQNIKKATMAKRDNIKTTGKGGMGKFTEIDDLVLDILGKESAIICGLGVRASLQSIETSGPSGITSFSAKDPKNIDQSEEPVVLESSHGIKRKKSTTTSTTPKLSKRQEIKCDPDKDELMKQFLQNKIYKTQLESYLLEKKIGFSRSKFTVGLPDDPISCLTTELSDIPGTSTLVVGQNNVDSENIFYLNEDEL